jgi:hypothetical protein
VPAVAGADFDPGCKQGTITGESNVDPNSGNFIGAGTLGFDGLSFDIQWVSSISSETADQNGTLTLHSSHHITNGQQIDFKTSDLVTATPTGTPGLYDFTSHLDVVSGIGRVHSGYLDVHGTVDLIQGHVALNSSSGSLCPQPQ